MHKLKNKKLLSIFLAGIISYSSLSIGRSYAEEIKDNTTNESIENNSGSYDSEDNINDEDSLEEEENIIEAKDIKVNEINNTDNIGLNVKTQGSIINIQENKIYIKDETGEGSIYLDKISVNNLQIGDTISVIGIITQIDNENTIVINDINNIDIILNEEIQEEETQDEEIENENITEDEEVQEDKSDKVENSSEDKKDKNNKPSSSTSNKTTKVTSSKSDEEELVANSIKSKSEIIIESDLTSAQWEEIKLQLENKTIKVKDLENNKIRITQVSNECGDNIWIVNDPRMLDSEESNTTSNYILDTILYSEYDVSESKWNSIVEDVENKIAKIKYDSEKNLKIIYQKSDDKDYILTLNKVD